MQSDSTLSNFVLQEIARLGSGKLLCESVALVRKNFNDLIINAFKFGMWYDDVKLRVFLRKYL